MGTVFGSISVETPKYTSISKNAVYEVRHYAKQLRCETTVDISGDMSGQLNSPFRTLAGYIFGKNSKGGGAAEKVAMTAPVTMTEHAPEKIAMTAPVTMQEQQAGGGTRQMTMAFIMPSQYTSVDQLPTPLESKVKLVEVPAFKAAAITFSGGYNAAARQAKEAELRAACSKDGVELTQDPAKVQFGAYNPPWCLPPLRTNEVVVPLAEQ